MTKQQATIYNIIGRALCALLLLLLSPPYLSAQTLDKSAGVRRLSFGERFSLKTNAVEWLLLTPNISMEYDLIGTNWSRWALQLDLKGGLDNPLTSSLADVRYRRSQVRLEVRNYWRTRQLTNRFPPHKYPWQKLFSTRRLRVKHPKTIYFRGAYAAYDNFSFLFGSSGVKGYALGAGFTYGIVKPIAQYMSGNSIDLELSISAGAAYVRYDKYGYDSGKEGEAAYPTTATGLSRVIPSIADIRVGFTYRFGKCPSSKKYRYRYDVDAEYQDRYDAEAMARDNKRRNDRIQKSVVRDMEDMFWELYQKETDKKRLYRERDHADRTGLDPDLATERSLELIEERIIKDSLATVARHLRELDVIGREEDIYERIRVYEETYNPKTHYGRDTKQLLKEKRKAAKQAQENAREMEKKQRALEKKNLAKQAEAERAKKLAEQKRQQQERNAARKAREDAERQELEQQKASNKAQQQALDEDVRRAEQQHKDLQRQKEAEKRQAEEDMKAEIKAVQQQAEAADRKAKEDLRKLDQKLNR